MSKETEEQPTFEVGQLYRLKGMNKNKKWNCMRRIHDGPELGLYLGEAGVDLELAPNEYADGALFLCIQTERPINVTMERPLATAPLQTRMLTPDGFQCTMRVRGNRSKFKRLSGPPKCSKDTHQQ
jgi:hypothetical protein